MTEPSHDPDPPQTRKRRGDPDEWTPPTAGKRSNTKSVLQQRLEAEREATRLRLAKLQRLRDEELARRPVSPPGTHGDLNFYARFIKVGQGDCIVMCTPKGRRILVDCGSTATEVDDPDVFIRGIRDNLQDPKFLGSQELKDGEPVPRTIDVLILTHADEDHFNKLARALTGTGVTVDKVYHSGERAHYGTAGNWLLFNGTRPEEIRKVVHNKEKPPAVGKDAPPPGPETGPGEITFNGVAVPPADNAAQVDRLDAQGGIRIIAETVPFCTVTILAAGVSTDHAKDNSDAFGKNRGSIVTLVEVFEGTGRKKLLLCGDATTSTEKHLTEKGRYAEQNKLRLAAVDVAHVAHHGSAVTSSSQEWVDLVNPKDRALICAGLKGISSHHLPSWPVVRRYEKQLKDAGRQVVGYPLTAWDTKRNLYDTVEENVEAPIYTTGSHGNQNIDWLRLP
ncbi:ComEC/Rec2 family competence protein [Parafrankia discariae]|uniref:ComEC/Rec2 family competence protein n=1 Tax=Parafrankia discariae TaxID=365528 RepID=UPI00037E9DF9|nr:MBL fold metallo-hydrolase [Parafrankia discariae]